MMAETPNRSVDTQCLRVRNITQQVEPTQGAKSLVEGLNAEQEGTVETDKEKKTFGRTPNGTGKCCHCSYLQAHCLSVIGI
jgi:hypothetical protein